MQLFVTSEHDFYQGLNRLLREWERFFADETNSVNQYYFILDFEPDANFVKRIENNIVYSKLCFSIEFKNGRFVEFNGEDQW